jgi:TRAP-type mannitol/chloroaromatic compound transport system permease small subunit
VSGAVVISNRSTAIRLLDQVSLGFNHVGTLLIVAAMFLITADVIGRGVFNHPVPGVPEMVGVSIVAIVFLQIANALRAGRMIRSDSLLYALARKHPTSAHFVEAICALLGAVLFAATINAAGPLVIEAYKADTFIGATGFFTMPIWPVKAVVVLGCVLMVLQYLRLAWDKFALAAQHAPWSGDTPE